MTSYEFWGTVVAVLTLAFTGWKFQRNNIREFQKLSDNEEKTREKVAKIELDIEKVITDRTRIVKEVYEEITELRKMHMTDTKEIYAALSHAVDKTTGIEERHHNEVMTEIKGLSTNLTEMCATFAEYRKTRNGRKTE